MTPDCALPCTMQASPNHDSRPPDGTVDILLLHYTGMRDADAACAWLASPRSRVSSHYFVHADGRVVQLVPEARRAWHAGLGAWRGARDVNARSIGVEIDNPGHEWGYVPFPDAQIDAVIALSADILARHPIAPERVLAHSDVAPARKADPGELFPWARLAGAGIGHWVAPAPLSGGLFLQEGESGQKVEALQSMLALYGYDVAITGRFDAATGDAVRAFQRHFRPARVDGVADASTVTTLHRLLAALPALG